MPIHHNSLRDNISRIIIRERKYGDTVNLVEESPLAFSLMALYKIFEKQRESFYLFIKNVYTLNYYNPYGKYPIEMNYAYTWKENFTT